MSSLAASVPSAVRARPWVEAACWPLFAGALAGSAVLLFSVQPLFAKLVLPVLGSSPAVWSVATVGFQVLLLAGYGYAHLLAGLPRRAGLLVHLALLGAAACTLPIGIGAGWREPPPPGSEAAWLIGLMVATIGLPFGALAATAPLLQAWFARTAHRSARDPYGLYAASNIGSFLALAAYPLLIEPGLTLGAQSRVWAAGFLVVAALIGIAGAVGAMSGREAAERVRAPSGPAPGLAIRLGWLARAAVPSGLLVAVTAHISTDVAAIPLLWVVPLALFLLTFVIAFRPAGGLADREFGAVQVAGTALALGGWGSGSLLADLGGTLALFTVAALGCHRALFRARPDASRLTSFYLTVSLGGALGGIAAAIVAPLVFDGIVEYPILLVAALALRPAPRSSSAGEAGSGRLVAVVCGLGAAALALGALAGLPGPLLVAAAPLCLAALAITLWRDRLLSAAILAVVAALAIGLPRLDGSAESRRSFFGVHKIALTQDGRFRTLSHGTTIHGAMRVRNDDGTPATGRPEPTTYYAPDGNMGTAIAAIREAAGGRLGRVSVVGLGTGSLACHAGAGEAWRFYEIDEAVIRLAEDPRLFRFMAECGAGMPVVLGDARLRLADAEPNQDLIVLDAFSSDSIPVHLLTREAVALYASKLAPGGVILMHISNRHLDLRGVLGDVAGAAGLVALTRTERLDEPVEKRLRAGSRIVVMAREPAALGRLADDPRWTRLVADPTRRVWSDDYSNILQALRDGFAADDAPNR